MKLSNEAMGSLMMCLQKCLLEQSDITVLLRNLEFKSNEQGELFVMNPPIIRLDENLAHETETGVDTDFSVMNVRDLRGLAKEVGITGYSKMKKNDLVDVLQQASF